MVFLVFDTQHTNNIPMDSPEHGDHHDTLGMHRARSKHELPTSEGMTFFLPLRAPGSAHLTRPILDEERSPDGDLGRVQTVISHTCMHSAHTVVLASI
jgi:hypothetical protein